MKRPSIHTQRRDALDVKMTPMIDVVFLLLVFFVWTASFRTVEYALRSSVSEAAPSSAAADPMETIPEELDFAEVVIRVVWSGGAPAWLLNDQPLASLDDLAARLRLIHEVNQAAPVVIHPDAAAPLGHVIDVYDLARLAGFEEVRLAAEA